MLRCRRILSNSFRGCAKASTVRVPVVSHVLMLFVRFGSGKGSAVRAALRGRGVAKRVQQGVHQSSGCAHLLRANSHVVSVAPVHIRQLGNLPVRPVEVRSVVNVVFMYLFAAFGLWWRPVRRSSPLRSPSCFCRFDCRSVRVCLCLGCCSCSCACAEQQRQQQQTQTSQIRTASQTENTNANTNRNESQHRYEDKGRTKTTTTTATAQTATNTSHIHRRTQPDSSFCCCYS